MTSSLRRGCLLSVAAAFWAAAFLIPFKGAAEMLPRATAVFGMLAAAALLNTVVDLGRSMLRPGARPGLRAANWRLAGLLAACAAVGNLGMANSLFWVPPAVSSVVIQLQVVLVPLGEWLWLRQRPGPALWLGAGLALAGFVVMQLPWLMDAGDAVDASAVVKGSLWALLGAAGFGLMLLATRHAIAAIDPLRVNSLRLWMAAGLMLCWPGQFAAIAQMDARSWALCAAAAACGPITSRLLLMRSARYLPASQTKLFSLVSPIFAIGLGFLFFGELPGLLTCIGGLVILLGVALPLVDASRGSAPNEVVRSAGSR